MHLQDRHVLLVVTNQSSQPNHQKTFHTQQSEVWTKEGIDDDGVGT